MAGVTQGHSRAQQGRAGPASLRDTGGDTRAAPLPPSPALPPPQGLSSAVRATKHRPDPVPALDWEDFPNQKTPGSSRSHRMWLRPGLPSSHQFRGHRSIPGHGFVTYPSYPEGDNDSIPKLHHTPYPL